MGGGMISIDIKSWEETENIEGLSPGLLLKQIQRKKYKYLVKKCIIIIVKLNMLYFYLY